MNPQLPERIPIPVATLLSSRLWSVALLLLLPALLFTCRPGAVVPENADLDAFTAHLDERIPALMDDYGIPGVIVALVREGEPVWSGAYGYADRASGRPMTVETICRVESISKPVTAWGVMKLVEEGKIDLDRPVVAYLENWSFPESEFPVEAITARQLLSHTAGLELGTIGVRYDPRGEIPTLKEQLTQDARLFQPSGAGFAYSNTGFNVLELLIEEVTGRDFAEYMEREVLQPLGMGRASFNWEASFDPPVPTGYDLGGEPIPEYIYPDKAAGGLFAPIGDIAAFAAAGMPEYDTAGLQVLAKESIQQLYRPVADRAGAYSLAFDGYGLGYFIETLPTGQQAVAHGGQGSGWMTHFQIVPETGDALVIFCNSQRSWPFFSYLLRDWARWRGFGSVGMGVIAEAARWLWLVIGGLALVVIWQGVRLARGLLGGRRRFAPLAKEDRGLRWMQTGLFAGILIVLGWALSQPYLFFSAVFPVAAGWLGWALLGVALAALISALFPEKNQPEFKQKRK